MLRQVLGVLSDKRHDRHIEDVEEREGFTVCVAHLFENLQFSKFPICDPGNKGVNVNGRAMTRGVFDSVIHC